MTIYNFENISKIVFVMEVINRLWLRIRGFEKCNKSYTEMPRKPRNTVTNRFTDMTNSGVVFFFNRRSDMFAFVSDGRFKGACVDFRHSKRFFF